MLNIQVVLLISLYISGSAIGKNVKIKSEDLTRMPCPAEGIDIDRRPGNWITYYHNIPLWQQCGELCRSYPDCAGWTWNSEEPDKGECNIWNNAENTSQIQGKVSGLRDCPGYSRAYHAKK